MSKSKLKLSKGKGKAHPRPTRRWARHLKDEMKSSKVTCAKLAALLHVTERAVFFWRSGAHVMTKTHVLLARELLPNLRMPKYAKRPESKKAA